MGQENVDMVHRLLRAFNDGDVEARDGRLVRRQVFLTLAEALEAVGLRE
jgi:hypothetical protein